MRNGQATRKEDLANNCRRFLITIGDQVVDAIHDRRAGGYATFNVPDL